MSTSKQSSIIILVLLLLLLTLPSCSSTKILPKPELPDRSEIQKKTLAQGNSVVFISVYDDKGKPLSAGSGFFISKNGQILTNYHVIANGYSAIVSTLDGKTYKDVYLLSQDKYMDIALLRVNETNAPHARLGNSDTVKEADKVISVSNLKGLQNSVSDGFVTSVKKIEKVKIFQIDCNLLPESSGGPLYNIDGEVVGITTITSASGPNINFAVPINYFLSLQIHPKELSLSEIYVDDRNIKINDYKERQKKSRTYEPHDALFDEAFELYQKADLSSNAAPASPSPTVSEAKVYSGNGISLLEKAISINPYYHAANFLLGSIYAGRQNQEKAEMYLKRSIELKPLYPVAYLKLAKIYKDSRRNIDAIKFYRIGLEMNLTDELSSNDELLISSSCDLVELRLENNPYEGDDICNEIEGIALNLSYLYPIISNRLSYIFLKKGALRASYRSMKAGYWDLNAEDTKERIKIYKRYLEENNFYAWASVGKIYYDIKDYEKAIEYLRKAWQIDKGEFDQYHELGDAFFAKDQYSEAVSFLEEGLRKDQNNYDILVTLGNVYFFYPSKPNYQRAIELFGKAIQLNPFNYWPYYRLSMALNNNGKPHDALREINNSLSRIPKDNKYFNQTKKNVFILKGDILLKLNENVEAMKSYEEAIMLLDVKKDLYIYIDIATKIGKLKIYDKAIKLLKEALAEVKKTDNSSIIYYNLSTLGDIYADKSDIEEALSYYLEAVKLFPENYSGNFNVAEAYHSLKKWDEAEIWWKKTLALDPERRASVYNLGLVYFNTNRIDLALSSFKKALEIDPTFDKARLQIKDCEAIIENRMFPERLRILSLRKDSVGYSAKLLSLAQEYNSANNLYIDGKKETEPVKSGQYITSYSVSSKIYEASGRFGDILKKLETLKNVPAEYEDVIRNFSLAVSNRVAGIEQHSQGYYINAKDYRGEFEKGAAKIKLGDKNFLDCMEALLRLMHQQKIDMGNVAIETLERTISYYKKR